MGVFFGNTLAILIDFEHNLYFVVQVMCKIWYIIRYFEVVKCRIGLHKEYHFFGYHSVKLFDMVGIVFSYTNDFHSSTSVFLLSAHKDKNKNANYLVYS